MQINLFGGFVDFISEISHTSQINRNSSTDENNNSYISAPYIHGTSERVAKILRPHGVNLAHKPSRTLKHELCHLKDKKPVAQKSGVVYGLACQDCSATYVGETGRFVKDRMREHQNDVIKGKRLTKVYGHVNQTGHTFDFDNIKVYDSSSSVKTRLQLESIYTCLEPNPINRSVTLPSAYHPLLRSLRQ